MSSRLLVAGAALSLIIGTAGAAAGQPDRAASRAEVWTQTASWLASDPAGIAVGPNGDVWVITQGSTKVAHYNSAGTELGSAPGAGFLVLDLDVDTAGNVHQVLYDPIDPSGWVAVVGPDGQTQRSYVATTQVPPNSDSEFEPDGIALDAGGNATLFESDVRVGWHDEFRARYDAAGQRTWKTGGEGNGAISEQTDIASAPDGTTFVLDQADEKVHVYDPAGNLLRSWGQLGEEPGRTFFASGLAVSPWGTIFITDKTSRVQEFATDGTYLGALATTSGRNGGLDFGPGGELYVWSDEAFDEHVFKFVRGPAPTPIPTPNPNPTPGAASTHLASAKVAVRKGKARLVLTCDGATGQSCAGRVVLKARAGRSKKPLARAAYTISVGKKTVSIKLTKQGRQAVKRKSRCR